MVIFKRKKSLLKSSLKWNIYARWTVLYIFGAIYVLILAFRRENVTEVRIGEESSEGLVTLIARRRMNISPTNSSSIDRRLRRLYATPPNSKIILWFFYLPTLSALRTEICVARLFLDDDEISHFFSFFIV